MNTEVMYELDTHVCPYINFECKLQKSQNTVKSHSTYSIIQAAIEQQHPYCRTTGTQTRQRRSVATAAV